MRKMSDSLSMKSQSRSGVSLVRPIHSTVELCWRKFSCRRLWNSDTNDARERRRKNILPLLAIIEVGIIYPLKNGVSTSSP